HLADEPPELLELPRRRKRLGEHVVLPGGPPRAQRREEAEHLERLVHEPRGGKVGDDDGVGAGVRERAFPDHGAEGLHGGAVRRGRNGSEGVEGGGVVPRGGEEAEASERRGG
uniref:Uncharacterized protein n=1 Tax=Oryza brachyantha TaxID=4533 RepID=J3KWQ4_ORYBR